jgi:hypothetical protein
MASFNKFNCFVADIANKVHNLGTDTLKIMLTNSAPSASNTVKSDITEISAGNGYSAGGMTVTGVTSSQTSGTYKLASSADPVLTASGAVGPLQYAVLYNSTPASGNLIGWWDRGSAITLANTDTFTVDLDQTNGILQLA